MMYLGLMVAWLALAWMFSMSGCGVLRTAHSRAGGSAGGDDERLNPCRKGVASWM